MKPFFILDRKKNPNFAENVLGTPETKRNGRRTLNARNAFTSNTWGIQLCGAKLNILCGMGKFIDRKWSLVYNFIFFGRGSIPILPDENDKKIEYIPSAS